MALRVKEYGGLMIDITPNRLSLNKNDSSIVYKAFDDSLSISTSKNINHYDVGDILKTRINSKCFSGNLSKIIDSYKHKDITLEEIKNPSKNIKYYLKSDEDNIILTRKKNYWKVIFFFINICIFFSYKSVFDRKEIKRRSDYDTLTNLPNRYAITETGEDCISLSKKNDVYLAIIDIDFFKKINDTYGHLAGDKALINLADILRLKSSERGFFVGRYGGEEFVILSNSSTEDEFYHSLNELRKTVENNSFTYEDNVIKFTISGGMTKYKDNNSFEDLLANADKNLYIAKEKGRNIIIR